MHQKAFSLVELSIVLVILGLLTGGILAGQSLIRAAELRSISTEAGRYTTATQTFRDKYFALPGDMSNAISFWNSQHNTPATCRITASTDARTCNGNGNGQIEMGAAGANESFRFWQHLANAGLVEGTYSGIAHQIGGDPFIDDNTMRGYNVPSSKLGNAVWFVNWGTEGFGGTAATYQINAKHYFMFGQPSPTSHTMPGNPVLKAEEAWNIDTKMDDGVPNAGKVIGYSYTSCAPPSGAAYDLGSSAAICALIFAGPF